MAIGRLRQRPQHALRQAALEVERHRRRARRLRAPRRRARARQARPGAEHAPALVGQQRLDAGGAGQEQRSRSSATSPCAGWPARSSSASRYLATVRRATWMPCSPSISASWLSDSGLVGVLGGHQLLDQRAHRGARRIAAGLGVQRRAEEVLQLEGADRRGHVLGRGHARDGRSRAGPARRRSRAAPAASSRSRRGVKKPFWRSTMACDTRRMVSKRCWMFFMNQRASCSRADIGAPRAVALALDGLRIQVVDAQLGHHVGVEHHLPAAAGLLHDHVGHDDVGLGCA